MSETKKYWLGATEVSKEFKSKVRVLADALDMSISALVILALVEKMERVEKEGKASQEVER